MIEKFYLSLTGFTQRVDLGVMAMKEYSTFRTGASPSNAVVCHILNTH